jgi:outer membrane protein insertion porin family
MKITIKFSILLIASLFAIQLQTKAQIDTSNTINYAFPTKYEIADISVSGEGFDKALILAVIGISPGQRVSIPGDEITNAVQALWKQGLFSDAKLVLKKIDGGKVWLEVQVKSRPRLTSFKFPNVKKSQAKKLKEQIRISAGALVTEQLISNAVYHIKQYYIGKGRPNSTINVIQERDTTGKKNAVKLIFEVDKGPRVKIQEIVFEGSKEFSDRKSNDFLRLLLLSHDILGTNSQIAKQIIFKNCKQLY